MTGDHQSKLTLMSESLRNDGRVWVPKKKGDSRRPNDIPEDERDYYLERRYPSFGNLVPRDVASRAAKEVCDEGRGVGPGGYGVYLDFRDAIERLGLDQIREKYGNLFEIYERITGEDAYEVPMRIYPAVHYTMGGLWVDYHLMSNIPGLFVAGEANFSDQGANRLGASALMQGLADGYFILPCTAAQLPGLDETGEGRYLAPGVPRGRGRGPGAHRRAPQGQGPADGRQHPPRAGQAAVGRLRHGPVRGEPAARARQDPRAARGVPQQRPRAGHRRRAEPVAREGRPRR